MSEGVEVGSLRWVPRTAGPAAGVMLEFVDPARLDEHDLVSAIAAAEAQAARMHAIQAELIAELAGRDTYTICPADPRGGGDAGDPDRRGHVHRPVAAVGQEISLALSVSPNQGIARAALAVELAGPRQALLAALRAGTITLRKADTIIDRLRPLHPDQRGRIEADLLAGNAATGGLTDTQLRRILNRAVLAADPAAAQRRHHDTRRDRRVDPPRDRDTADGAAELTLTGPVDDLTALYTAVDAAARAARGVAGETRTLDQLRFDTLTGLGWTALSTGHLGCCHPTCTGTPHAIDSATGDPRPGHAATDGDGSGSSGGGVRRAPARLARRHGRPATVNVTVAYTTLVGLDDHPAHLDGYGPIPAPMARRIAADATLRRLLTDPATGTVQDYGRTTYQPPRHLADHVIARDRTCRFPTCDTSATSCDLDHAQPWNTGGTTDADNLHALSRRCHTHKTFHHWTITAHDNGDLTWTTPAGHTRRIAPEAIGPTRPKPNPGSPPDLTHDPPPF
jgi:hypothetical protein